MVDEPTTGHAPDPAKVLLVGRLLASLDRSVREHRCDRELGVGYDTTDVATAAATRGFVSEAVLTALGPEGYLVNIARGSVVDEPALVDALVGGRLAGAALDAFADEPHVPPALLDLDTVLLLPHIASATRETREAMGDLAFRNLRRFMSDGTLLTPVPAPGSSR